MCHEGCRATTQLQLEGVIASAAHCDVTNKAEVDALVNWTVQTYGAIDLLIANAGIVKGADFLDMTEQDFDDVIRVNLKGVFLVSMARLCSAPKHNGTCFHSCLKISVAQPRFSILVAGTLAIAESRTTHSLTSPSWAVPRLALHCMRLAVACTQLCKLPGPVCRNLSLVSNWVVRCRQARLQLAKWWSKTRCSQGGGAASSTCRQ